MRYFLFLLLFFSANKIIYAQDTVVKRNGDRIAAKVTEVNTSEIKYKRLDIPDGPVYVLSKGQIKYVIYANGTRESFEDYVPEKTTTLPPIDLTISPSGWKYFYKERRITEPDMLAIAEKLGDKKINFAVKKTENIRFMQNVSLVAGIAGITVGSFVYYMNRPVNFRSRRGGANPNTYARANARQNGIYMMLGGLGCELVSVGLRFNRKNHAHLVMEAYNKTLGK
ncbi:MAG TPA: hypothetical protein VII99_03610 [Bacteroidia bacterium]